MMSQGNVVAVNEEDLLAINRVYAELLQITGDFLRQANDTVPSDKEVAGFCERRAGLLRDLQPLVERQRQWLLVTDRATLSESVVARVDAQLEQMRQLEDVGAQLLEKITLYRADFEEQLGQVRSGKKALSGYGKGPKIPPRFCRGTV